MTSPQSLMKGTKGLTLGAVDKHCEKYMVLSRLTCMITCVQACMYVSLIDDGLGHAAFPGLLKILLRTDMESSLSW